MPRTYSTARAFRKAVEERIKRTALNSQFDIPRLRRQISFDRLLARLFYQPSPPWVLKGGYALELRFTYARTTVDIDLTVQQVASQPATDQNQTIQAMLQRAADANLGDWFEFKINPPMMDLTAAPYGGARYGVSKFYERILVR